MVSETPDIGPFPTSCKRELLTQAVLETQKGGTLRLLDEEGVHFPSRRALEISADHGAKVDMETKIVRTAPLHQCHAGLTNTLKHVRGGMTVPPRLAPCVIEMVTAVTGSAEALLQRPPICTNFRSTAPPSQDGHGLENALTYTEAGIPRSLMAMPTMGSTAPTTPLGALVMGGGECDPARWKIV